MHLIQRRHDNGAPTLDKAALEAFLYRRHVRADLSVRVREGRLTKREQEHIRYASFLPPGSNVHRSNNLYLPDQPDPFAPLVTFLAHFDTTFNASPGGVATLDGPPTLLGPPLFGAGCYTAASGTMSAQYSGACLKGNGPVTYELWVNPVVVGGGQARFFLSSTLIGGSFFLGVFANAATGTFGHIIRGGAVDTGVILPINTWSALAVTAQDGTPVNGGASYINGARVQLGTQNAGNSGSAATFFVGEFNAGLNGIAGRIDEVRITWADRYNEAASYTVTGPFPNP